MELQIKEEGMIYLADIETDAALAPLQSAAYNYRIVRYADFHGVHILELR